ncbi:Os06g0189200, partial [Oryza sativa Japonica Group]
RGCGRRWCSWCGGRTPWRGRSAGRGSAGRRTGSSSAATPRRTRCARRRARPALPRHRPARAAALPRVDVALRQGVRLVERRHARALRRRLSHGEADPVRPDGAVRQTGARAELSGADRQRPRLRQRRRLGAAPPRRAPGVRHGQAQDDGQDDGGVRAGGDSGVGGACRRRRAAGAGGGRAEVPGADRRRDLAYGVRQHTSGERKEVFVAQRELQSIAFSTIYSIRFPGSECIATKTNLRRRHLAKKVRGTLRRSYASAPGRRRRQGGQRIWQRPPRPNAGGQRGGRRRRRREEPTRKNIFAGDQK